MAASTKSLFQATKPKRDRRTKSLFSGSLPDLTKPATRDPLDFDPTPADATSAFLAAEGGRIRQIGGAIWEPAVGAGHIADVLAGQGFDVIGNDVVDRGWPDTVVRSFFEYSQPQSDIIITNPPYNEVSARDGHGRWLRHTFDLNVRYCAMLLNWDWIAARINGMDELHSRFPVSRAYVCTWKIDFRGGGSPPQRNGWLVWDRDWTGETVLRRLFRETPDPKQGSLI